MKKKLLLLVSLVSLGLLAGCGSDDAAGGDTSSVVGKAVYENTDFNLLVPEDWEKLEKGDFTGAVPAGTVVAIRNNVKSDLFTANVGVSRSELEKEMTSTDLAVSSLSKAKVRLVGFSEGAASDLEVVSGEKKLKGRLVHFSGRKSPSDPVVQFDQLFVVDEKVAFVLTGAYLETEDESVVKQVGEMLNSFALK